MKKENKFIQTTISRSLIALLLTLRQFVDKEIEAERIARLGTLLLKSGIKNNNSVFEKIAKACLDQQKADGGWIGVEDTTWICAFLKDFGGYQKEYQAGIKWLQQQELTNGAWGKSNRDIGRIPITGILLYLLPELSNKNNLAWLENEWKRDLLANPALTYKASFFLMPLKRVNKFENNVLLKNTIDWLLLQQNEDYGWGPCKGHPVGSTPFCTGVALAGLLQHPDVVGRNVVANAFKWLEKNQLNNGLWPDHYIEEGSAWCFYALTEGYKFLKGNQ